MELKFLLVSSFWVSTIVFLIFIGRYFALWGRVVSKENPVDLLEMYSDVPYPWVLPKEVWLIAQWLSFGFVQVLALQDKVTPTSTFPLLVFFGGFFAYITFYGYAIAGSVVNKRR